MGFDYSLYVDVCLKEASSGIAICMFASFIIIFNYIKKKIGKSYHRIGKVGILFFVMIIICFLFDCGGKLSHGIWLINEKEADAVEINGEITKMKEIDDFCRGIAKDKYGYNNAMGTIFTVNGIKCTAPLDCGLEVGDYVFVRYLPKSRYILYVSETEEPAGGD